MIKMMRRMLLGENICIMDVEDVLTRFEYDVKLEVRERVSSDICERVNKETPEIRDVDGGERGISLLITKLARESRCFVYDDDILVNSNSE
ncbi:hypothetical protein G9A89_008729 [Geosiphon pyriformis]|nr:hypothetical protein G9A89_008729 [Geosiphon pyriformis]